MITARLLEGISIKTCNQCGEESANVDYMLKHLNIHRLAELEKLMNSKPIDRYGGLKT